MSFQETVKEIYLKVIAATIEGSKAEFEETDSTSDTLLATLESLQERWGANLIESHDFTEDPTAWSKPPHQRGSRGSAGHGSASAHQRRSAAADNRAGAVKAEIGVVGDANGGGFARTSALAQAPPLPEGEPLPSVPRIEGLHSGAVRGGMLGVGHDASGPSHSNIPQGDGAGGTSSPDAEPVAKRMRRDEEAVNDNEDLDDDSDPEQSDESDEVGENFIVAQHDSVKKGGGNGKWKVRLKDGILHLNGREYLFTKASCDLDW